MVETSSQDSDMESLDTTVSGKSSKKRRIGSTPPFNISYSQAVRSTVKRKPKTMVNTNTPPSKPKKYLVIMQAYEVELGQQNPIKVQRLIQSLGYGTPKWVNGTRRGIIIECTDSFQFKSIIATLRLGDWQVKCTVPKSQETSIGCNVKKRVKKSEVCENCGRAPETAKHFLLECAAYSDNRNVMLQVLIAQGVTDFSMQSLLSEKAQSVPPIINFIHATKGDI
ncbi:unnamed protein product [Mytilus coruscus]|uniref:Uncharacterized protein n=1 Tax=Mytilus coruscus TaxID=42192 RepID=A0A6J8BB08_MYTCO|nr:unnamed protein product [Mytilus coruscus]